MAAAEQDDAKGVLSRGAGAAVRISSLSWHANDALAAATSGVRNRSGLEAASAALAGNGDHSSIIAPGCASERRPYPPFVAESRTNSPISAEAVGIRVCPIVERL
jgi:hypothetical protein